MLGLFGDVKKLLKLDEVWIDNNIFRLHYKATVIIFVTSSLLVTSKQFFGDPIDCIVDGIPGNVMDTYCWIHSTFSIPTRWTGTEGAAFPHPGVSPHADLTVDTKPKYHKYYQWVCFVLFFQAAFFYLPRYFWKLAEGGKIALLIQGLKEPMIEDKIKEPAIDNIAKYWRLHRGTHTLYFFQFFACEILNFLNCIGQLYFTNFFLDGEFGTYGMDVMRYSEMEPEERIDPMVRIFPKVTKCTFYKYGPSGTVETKDGLCVLPLNIINEKIYILIWFWLVILACISGICLIYRLATILGPQIRVALISVKGGRSLERSNVEDILEPEALSFFEKVGDWFVLYLIVKNLDVLTVNQVVRKIHSNDHHQNISDTETLKMKPQTSQV